MRPCAALIGFGARADFAGTCGAVADVGARDGRTRCLRTMLGTDLHAKRRGALSISSAMGVALFLLMLHLHVVFVGVTRQEYTAHLATVLLRPADVPPPPFVRPQLLPLHTEPTQLQQPAARGEAFQASPQPDGPIQNRDTPARSSTTCSPSLPPPPRHHRRHHRRHRSRRRQRPHPRPRPPSPQPPLQRNAPAGRKCSAGACWWRRWSPPPPVLLAARSVLPQHRKRRQNRCDCCCGETTGEDCCCRCCCEDYWCGADVQDREHAGSSNPQEVGITRSEFSSTFSRPPISSCMCQKVL